VSDWRLFCSAANNELIVKTQSARDRPQVRYPKRLDGGRFTRIYAPPARQVSHDRTKDPKVVGEVDADVTLPRRDRRTTGRGKAFEDLLLLGFVAFVLKARCRGRRCTPMHPCLVLSHGRSS